MAGITERTFARPRVVVSRCIEFDPCRYDGSRIPSREVALLKEHAECIPVCPEVEIGLGVPRPAVRLVRVGEADRLVQPATGRDVTDAMVRFTAEFLGGLPPVDGFILKGGSPTSGPRNVKVYPGPGRSAASGRAVGLFAREVLRRFPLLPVEDEQRLRNGRIRDHFLTRIFTLASFREVEQAGDPGRLVAFHAENKLLLLAHSQDLARRMGRLLSVRGSVDREALFGAYRAMLCEALARVPRYTQNVNVLLHVLGHFRDRVTRGERDHCLRLIARYREGTARLAEPRDLLRSWVIRFREESLVDQTFFAPFPPALGSLPDEITDRGRDMFGDGPRR
ncbi:MAG: DUF523 and DUF1722 domain-containing protein [Methanolinea sp.]|nr:DUF523 and DUF1722 domain-containing protein [Methanolinea sp.]